eukprot:3142382-Alexandrium_andersonii.AAC.1
MPHPASNDGEALGVEAHTAPATAGTTTPNPRISEPATSVYDRTTPINSRMHRPLRGERSLPPSTNLWMPGWRPKP